MITRIARSPKAVFWPSIGCCLFALLQHNVSLAEGSANDQPNADKTTSEKRSLVFESDILPVIKAKCIRCHNPKARKGDLDLSSFAGVLIKTIEYLGLILKDKLP